MQKPFQMYSAFANTTKTEYTRKQQVYWSELLAESRVHNIGLNYKALLFLHRGEVEQTGELSYQTQRTNFQATEIRKEDRNTHTMSRVPWTKTEQRNSKTQHVITMWWLTNVSNLVVICGLMRRNTPELKQTNKQRKTKQETVQKCN